MAWVPIFGSIFLQARVLPVHPPPCWPLAPVRSLLASNKNWRKLTEHWNSGVTAGDTQLRLANAKICLKMIVSPVRADHRHESHPRTAVIHTSSVLTEAVYCLFSLFGLLQSWAALKADAEESRAHAARVAMEAERTRHAEEEAQRKASLLQEALESLRSGDNPHLALHQLQLLHRLPLESVLSLQAQLCSCLQAVEQVLFWTG